MTGQEELVIELAGEAIEAIKNGNNGLALTRFLDATKRLWEAMP